MNINDLKIYLDLCQTLHFARTSERCHISPSTLSRLVQRLEQDIGASLLHRDNRNVSLTGAGQACRDMAEEVIAARLRFDRRLQSDAPALNGEVSMYCSVTASHSVLSDMLTRLRLSEPGIEIKLHTGDQASSVERLLAGQEDMVIAARPEKLPSKMAFLSLQRSRLLLIAPREPCPLREQILQCQGDWQQLAWSQLPLVLPERGLTRSHFEYWLRQNGIKPKIYAQVAGHEAIASMVALGCGLGVVPELVLAASPVRDSIEVIDIQPFLPDFDVGLGVLKARLDEALMKTVWSVAGNG